MIIGVGIDVVDISRIDERIARKILTERELEEFEESSRRTEYLAGRFALKEAFFKAIGSGIDGHSFKDLSFVRDEFGRPTLVLHKDFEPVFNFAHVSLSHDLVAAAVVVLERRKGGVFVEGSVEEFEILDTSGRLVEIDTPFGPFRTEEILEKSGGKLLRYGNLLHENRQSRE